MAKGAPGLAMIFGKSGSKSDPLEAEDDDVAEDRIESDAEEAPPAGFEIAAVEAIPDLADQPERIAALYRAVKAAQ